MEEDRLRYLIWKDEYIANNFDSDKSVNDFIKIDNNKFAFIFISYTNYTSQGISNSEIEYNSICIIILKLKKDPYNFDIKNYKINFGNIIPMIQILGYSYNNFLIFATTNLLYDDNNKNYFSLFMMFGCANGTDSIIDISIYLEKYINCQNMNQYFLMQMTY